MKTTLFAALGAVLLTVGAAMAGTAEPAAGKGASAHVKLTTDFPADVNFNVMPGHDGITNVKFKVTITNGSRHDETLSAPTPCEVRSWRIVDAAGAENQKEKKDPICTEQHLSLTLPAGKSITGPGEAKIQGKLLKDGETYTFEYTLYGYKAENKFTAHLAH